MTRRPICPACGSDQVTPDSTNGGAGRNRCVCGHVAAVREFYPDATAANPMPWIEPGERRFMSSADVVRNGVYGKMGNPSFTERYLQQPEPPTPGYRMNPKTGNLRPAKHHELHHGENPAPIRQYKDD